MNLVSTYWPQRILPKILCAGLRKARQIYLVYELQVLMDISTLYVRVQSQTFINLVIWLL